MNNIIIIGCMLTYITTFPASFSNWDISVTSQYWACVVGLYTLKSRYIKLSSPGMNNIIIIGGMLTYIATFPASFSNRDISVTS